MPAIPASQYFERAIRYKDCEILRHSMNSKTVNASTTKGGSLLYIYITLSLRGRPLELASHATKYIPPSVYSMPELVTAQRN